MKQKVRNILISVFVVVWLSAFHYESLRAFWLNPFFHTTLPKIKFLFPPAGWIMFYRVDPQFGYVEVYGVKDGQPQLIDPHQIIRTRTILFDNIHRNVLSTVSNPRVRQTFCQYLDFRFPFFDQFMITVHYYPDIANQPYLRYQDVRYRCE